MRAAADVSNSNNGIPETMKVRRHYYFALLCTATAAAAAAVHISTPVGSSNAPNISFSTNAFTSDMYSANM